MSKRKKIGFLFNHYLSYQVVHGAPFAFALSVKQPDLEVEILCSSPQSLAEAKAIAELYPGHRCGFRLLDPAKKWPILRLLPKALHRLAVLFGFKKQLAQFDALAAPEKNFILLKALPSFQQIVFIGLRHGAGDRPVKFNKGKLNFDYLLVPGKRYYERFKDLMPKGRTEIVGYPKFEVMAKRQPTFTSPFQNDRPTVLYCPHFSPTQSSWQKMGEDVLSFFAEHPEYNLIFAPHVRLFSQRRYHHNIDTSRFEAASNILIDKDSPRLLDMTYTRHAHIYLGDVSSQVYEFLHIKKRPCVFLNANGLDKDGMHFWACGPVIKCVEQLPDALKESQAQHEEHYLKPQAQHLEASFSSTAIPPSEQGAQAIANALKL